MDTVNCVDQTPLHSACAHGNVDMVELLLGHQAEIEHRDKDGMTPLLTAVKHGHVTVLKKLLHHGASVTVIDKEDRSPLYLAAEYNQLKCLKTLVKTNSIDWLMRRNDRWDNTAIHIASSSGNLDIVIALIEAGAQIDNKNEDEQTPVHLAAKHGQLKVLKYILGHDRYSVNDEDFESQTALHLASSGGHHDIVQELIRAGADIHARNSYLWSPLACAAAQGWVKCTSHLIKVNKLIMKYPYNDFSYTKVGASLETQDRNKNTPLHLAAKHGHDGVVQLLIDHGADLTAVNLNDNNPISEAISRGNQDVILRILQSERWREAIRHRHITTQSVKDTPVKQLIKRFPDLAKIVFDRSITSNLNSNNNSKTKNIKTVSPDSPDLKV